MTVDARVPHVLPHYTIEFIKEQKHTNFNEEVFFDNTKGLSII